jgi:hypothetical protein
MKRVIYIPTLLFIAITSHSQQLRVEQRKAIIDTLVRLVNSRYVYPEIAQQMTTFVKKHQQCPSILNRRGKEYGAPERAGRNYFQIEKRCQIILRKHLEFSSRIMGWKVLTFFEGIPKTKTCQSLPAGFC